jgi:hypothetical protein
MSDNNELSKFAVTTMIEVDKLLITLTSGFLVLSATIMNNLSGPEDPIKDFWIIVLCWISSIISILSGIIALGAIATTAHNNKAYDVDEFWTTWFLRFQQSFFDYCLFYLFVLQQEINKTHFFRSIFGRRR